MKAPDCYCDEFVNPCLACVAYHDKADRPSLPEEPKHALVPECPTCGPVCDGHYAVEPKECVWTENVFGFWEKACAHNPGNQHDWESEARGFCPSCGRLVKAVEWKQSQTTTEPKCEPNPILSCVCSRGTKCCPIDHRPLTTEPAESKGKAIEPPAWCVRCKGRGEIEGTATIGFDDRCPACNGTGVTPPTAAPAETTEEALEDRAKRFWREETYAEELPHKRLARFAQAEIGRQTPAIIERFVEDVEKEIDFMKNTGRYYAGLDHVLRIMQTVKARREGGEEE